MINTRTLHRLCSAFGEYVCTYTRIRIRNCTPIQLKPYDNESMMIDDATPLQILVIIVGTDSPKIPIICTLL